MQVLIAANNGPEEKAQVSRKNSPFFGTVYTFRKWWFKGCHYMVMKLLNPYWKKVGAY